MRKITNLRALFPKLRSLKCYRCFIVFYKGMIICVRIKCQHKQIHWILSIKYKEWLWDWIVWKLFLCYSFFCNGVRAVCMVSVSPHKLDAQFEILGTIYEVCSDNISGDHRGFWTEIIKPLSYCVCSSREDLVIGFIYFVLICVTNFLQTTLSTWQLPTKILKFTLYVCITLVISNGQRKVCE